VSTSRTARLGVFIVLAIFLLAVGSFLIGDRQLLFSRKFELRTTFKNVAGLALDAPVRVGGIQEGIVKRIELPAQPRSEVAVVMALSESTRAVLRTDSRATIQTEGLLGAKYVDISFGSPEGGRLAPGTTIPSDPPIEMADVMKKTTELLESVGQGAAHFGEVAEKIDRGAGTIGALVNDRSMYAQLNSATRNASQGAVAFQENMQALKRNFLLRGFFRNRGYDDSTRLLDHAITQLPAKAPTRKFTYDAKALFDETDSARLRNNKPLREAGQFLEQFPFEQVVVASAAGMKGDSDEMLVLTQARAMVVRDFLVSNFKMSDTRVQTIGLGKQQTAADGVIEILVYGAPAKMK
jgi:phospholipid/cholesterol/gamma-HCH transport system substrate-binding protein